MDDVTVNWKDAKLSAICGEKTQFIWLTRQRLNRPRINKECNCIAPIINEQSNYCGVCGNLMPDIALMRYEEHRKEKDRLKREESAPEREIAQLKRKQERKQKKEVKRQLMEQKKMESLIKRQPWRLDYPPDFPTQVCRECNKEMPLSDEFFKYFKNEDRFQTTCLQCLPQRSIRNRFRKKKIKKLDIINTLTGKEWEEIKSNFNGKCAYCDCETDDITMEHFIPMVKGGEYSKDNILPVCRSCNSSKGTSSFWKWYPTQPFYSKMREKRLLKYLNYKGVIQQRTMFG